MFEYHKPFRKEFWLVISKSRLFKIFDIYILEEQIPKFLEKRFYNAQSFKRFISAVSAAV